MKNNVLKIVAIILCVVFLAGAMFGLSAFKIIQINYTIFDYIILEQSVNFLRTFLNIT